MSVTLAKTSTTSGIVFALDVSDPAAASVRTGLLRSTWHKAINLSAADKAVFAALINGSTQPVEDVQRAIVAGLATSVTRWGQSMTRRAGSEPLLALYRLLPTLPGVLPLVEVKKSVQTRVEYIGNRVNEETERAYSHQIEVNQRLAADLTDSRRQVEQQRAAARLQDIHVADLQSIIEQQAERIAALQAAPLPEPVLADQATYHFAVDHVMTPDQRARAFDFRTGFRTGRSSN